MAFSVEGDVDGSNWKFVFVHGSNGQNVFVNRGDWKLVDVDGSNGQVLTAGLESIFVGSPGQHDFLTFGRDREIRSSVGVTSVRVGTGGLVLLVLGFFKGSIIRFSVTTIEFSF